MSLPGRKGYMPDIFTWTGLVDDEGRPDSHGVTPADSPCEFMEGAMNAGLQNGVWIAKWRDGNWFSYKFGNEALRGRKV